MSEWTRTTVGDVITLQRGFDITKALQNPGEVPVVSSGGISSYHDVAMTKGPGVVMGRKGTLGKVFYLDRDYWPHDTTLWVKDFKGNHPRFVYYFLGTLNFLSMDVGSSNPTLNRNHVHPVPINWPPLREQQGIAAVLGALDDKIAVNERIAATYEELLQCKFKELGLSDEPVDETAVSVTELIVFNPKLAKPSADEPVYVDMAALQTNRASIPTWTHRAPKSGPRFMNGDTLLARITPCLENGKTGYVDFMDTGEVGLGSTEFIVMRSHAGVPDELSYFLARDGRFREHAIRNMVGTSGRQRVSAADAANYFVNRPDGDAMAAFGEEAAAAFAHMKSLQGESRTLTTLRDTLLPQLMSGRLRVKDAEKIVEDAT
ncbi:restriction endonuclease subunit S [Actinacidiphila glaucinigra]|uniref:restriction endonuclease subunit S n=1 Tax=Actinacidiphila glaucinigra TaxID=235986 RepID=UPI0033AC4D19